MTDTITIRVLGPEDVDVLDRVTPGTFAQAPDPVHAWAFLTTGVNAMVVALVRGEVMGFATGLVVLHPDRPRGFMVTDLAVHPEFRGQGVGTRVMKRLRDVAQERGCETMAVLRDAENAAAQQVYTKTGGSETPDLVMVTWDLTAF